MAGAISYHVSLLFIFQGGFFVHLSGDLRKALAAVVGGIVNLLGMRRTLCSACKNREIDDNYDYKCDEDDKDVGRMQRRL